MFGKTSGNNTFKNKYPVAVSSTRKGRVGRVLFEFEERWFSLAEAIFHLVLYCLIFSLDYHRGGEHTDKDYLQTRAILSKGNLSNNS